MHKVKFECLRNVWNGLGLSQFSETAIELNLSCTFDSTTCTHSGDVQYSTRLFTTLHIKQVTTEISISIVQF